MVVKKLPEVNPPSGRVSGQGRLAAPILESRWRKNKEDIMKNGFVPRVFGMRGKYRPKGGTRGWPLPPGALVARPGGGPHQVAAWVGLGSPLVPPWSFLKLLS